MTKNITEYLSWKKRQLSSQSENGHNPPKKCDDSTASTDVFPEGLKSLDCLAIPVCEM